MQHRLKGPSGPARARVVPAELLDQLYVAVNDAVTQLDVGFAGDTPGAAYSSDQKVT
jgi:hypothetical protein